MPLSYLQNRHKGQRIFILGNGPSLNQVDLDLLANQIVIGTNRIYLKNFCPDYYIVEDILLWEDCKEEIAACKAGLKLIPLQFESFMPKTPIQGDWKFFRRIEDEPGKIFSCSVKDGLCFGGTVTYLALQLAYQLGAREAVLLGIDHRYTIPEGTAGADVDAPHLVSNGDDPNHFDPQYFGPGRSWHKPNLPRMERAYAIAEEVYRQAKRRVINATPGTALNVFERRDLSEVLR